MRVMAAVSLVLAVLVSGCAKAPVQGHVQSTGETFTGSATGYFTGHGKLTVRSSKGMACEGTFRYVEATHGYGRFTCSDGRKGPFEFTSSGLAGAGYGYLEEDLMVFEFGDLS